MQGGREPAGGGAVARTWLRIAATLLLLCGFRLAAQEGPIRTGPYAIERDSVRVVYWGDDRGVAEATLDAALAPLPLPGIPNPGSIRRGTVFLPPTPALFDSLTRGATPAWAAGVAIPSQRTIILPAYARSGPFANPVVTLRHEVAHLALAEYLGPNIPRWFTEGYATWVSGGWDERSGWQIRLALLGRNLPPFDSLTLGWPREEGRARLSYLLSASAVAHLHNSRGERAFAAFLEEWERVGTLDAAMRNVYLMSPEQFEREWRSMVRRRYGWLLALSQLTAFWLVLTVLLLLLGSRRRKRNRERMAELRREEYMLPPGEPWEEERTEGN